MSSPAASSSRSGSCQNHLISQIRLFATTQITQSQSTVTTQHLRGCASERSQCCHWGLQVGSLTLSLWFLGIL